MLPSKCTAHRKITPAVALSYGHITSIIYVVALYALLPSKVRRLHRNHPLQIRYRLCIVVVLSLVALYTYAPIFCYIGPSDDMDRPNDYYIEIESDVKSNNSLHVILSRNKDGYRLCSMQDFKVILHCMILFAVPMFLSGRDIVSNLLYSYPILEVLRNLIIGPLTEEIVFRACIVPPLLAAGFSTTMTVWCAPLFFGTAHIHHMINNIRNGISVKNALLITAVQFTYTYLFGAYSSFAYIKTGSVAAIFYGHAFCNMMGLPNVSFMSPKSNFYTFRWIIVFFYVLSIATFSKTFSSLNM